METRIGKQTSADSRDDNFGKHGTVGVGDMFASLERTGTHVLHFRHMLLRVKYQIFAP